MSKTKRDYSTVSKLAYTRFCEKHKDVNITFDKWKEVIYTFNRLFRDYILDTGEKAQLSGFLGSFSIAKSKPRREKILKNGTSAIGLPIDWKKTKECGKLVYHINAHSDGYKYKWCWFRSEARFFMSELWIFRPYRDSSRKLAEYIKKPNSIHSQMYREWKFNLI